MHRLVNICLRNLTIEVSLTFKGRNRIGIRTRATRRRVRGSSGSRASIGQGQWRSFHLEIKIRDRGQCSRRRGSLFVSLSFLHSSVWLNNWKYFKIIQVEELRRKYSCRIQEQEEQIETLLVKINNLEKQKSRLQSEVEVLIIDLEKVKFDSCTLYFFFFGDLV